MYHCWPSKLPLLAGALLLASTARAQPATSALPPAEPAPRPRNLLKIAPLGWVHGQMPFTVESRLGYERVLSRRSSAMASASYLGTNYVFGFIGSAAFSAALSSVFTLSGHPALVWSQTTIRARGARYQVQYRYYLGGAGGHAPAGVYLAPHFSYSQVDYTVRLDDFNTTFGISTTNRNYNLLVGYQRVLGRHFAFDVFTGLGYLDKTNRIYEPDGTLHDRLPVTGLKISSGLNLGWAF